MLALLVWKGMKAVGRVGQQGWARVRRRLGSPREPEAVEDAGQAPKGGRK
jgi:hypothetical protein